MMLKATDVNSFDARAVMEKAAKRVDVNTIVENKQPNKGSIFYIFSFY